MQLIPFRCILTILVAVFVLGLVTTALTPQPELPLIPIFPENIIAVGDLNYSGGQFSGQIVPMGLNPQSGLIYPIKADAFSGLFSGQIQTVSLSQISNRNHVDLSNKDVDLAVQNENKTSGSSPGSRGSDKPPQ